MSLSKVKVMVAGSVNGRLDLLDARITKINSSKVGPFDIVLCTGRFHPRSPNSDEAVHNAQFGDYIKGSKRLPIPTYFLVNDGSDGSLLKDSPEGAKVAENLFFLGSAGVQDLAGISVGYICQSTDEKSKAALLSAATKSGPQGLDILLSNEWPEGVLNFTPAATIPLSNEQEVAMTLEMQEIAKTVHPRYHFAASMGAFLQRPPFSSPPTSTAAVLFTRFVAIANVSESTAKEHKWLHALSLTPARQLLAAGGEKNLAQLQNLPKGCTSNPYCPKPPPPPADDSFDDNAEGPIHPDGPVTKRPRMRAPQEAQARAPWDASRANELVRESNSNAQSFFFGDVRPGANGGCRGLPPGYVCRICNVPGHHIRDCPQASGAPRTPPDGYICKICGTPGHFINDCPQGQQERAARGPRPPRDPNARCWFCLGSSDVETHLIASIGNEAYLAMPKGAINDGHVLIVPISHDIRTLAASPDSVLKEVQTYKEALKKFYASTGRGAVFFERAIAITQSQSHAFVEALPVPLSKADELGPLFIEMGSKVNMDFQVVPDFASVVDETDGGSTQYFCVELPDETCLVHRFHGFNKKSIQFGRAVLTHLLGCPERRSWKTCQVPKAEEEKLTQSFKRGFESYDPADDDSDDDSDSD